MEYFLVTVKLSCSNNVFPSIATHVLSFWDQVCARESLMRAPRPRTHSCRSRAATWLTLAVRPLQELCFPTVRHQIRSQHLNGLPAMMPCRGHSAPIADLQPESCPRPSLEGMLGSDPLSNASPKRYAVRGFDLHDSNRRDR